MKFVFASDSFKGSLSSRKIADLLEQAAKTVFPNAETLKLPVADGGEGTADSLICACGGKWKEKCVAGPLFQPVNAQYGILPDGTAIIEMSQASGLTLVPEHLRNPMNTTTFGTGELILDAISCGCRNILLAIGGSATNDGGMGMASALGVRFFDQNGNVLAGIGSSLAKVQAIDCGQMQSALQQCQFTVMCDVKNILTGPEGASMTFGGQKGADLNMQIQLDKGMLHYAGIAEKKAGRKLKAVPGSGAAGGLGFGLMAFLNAELKSGIETVLDLVDFDRLIQNTDLVITGEGRMDWQSAYGKVPAGIGMRCQKAGVPAVAIVGGLGQGYEQIYGCGIRSIMPIVSGPMSLSESMKRAEELYSGAADRLFRLFSVNCQKNHN